MSPCPHCERPVRPGELACPFCKGAMPENGGGAWQRLALGSAVIVAASSMGVGPAESGGKRPPGKEAVTRSPSPSPSGNPRPLAHPPYGAAVPPSGFRQPSLLPVDPLQPPSKTPSTPTPSPTATPED